MAYTPSLKMISMTWGCDLWNTVTAPLQHLIIQELQTTGASTLCVSNSVLVSERHNRPHWKGAPHSYSLDVFFSFSLKPPQMYLGNPNHHKKPVGLRCVAQW
jgi:hypothetical protein